MYTEYELRVLEIDQEKIIEKLEILGATKIGEWNQKRYVYNTNPVNEGKWIRLRTNGEVTTLTYKNVVENTIDGTKEIEVVVDDFDTTNQFLECIGFKAKAYQENKRIQYKLDDVEIDIDTWPMIPTYLELEGQSEEVVMEMLKKLDLNESKVTTLSPQDLYIDIYGIDITKMKVIKF